MFGRIYRGIRDRIDQLGLVRPVDEDRGGVGPVGTRVRLAVADLAPRR